MTFFSQGVKKIHYSYKVLGLIIVLVLTTGQFYGGPLTDPHHLTELPDYSTHQNVVGLHISVEDVTLAKQLQCTEQLVGVGSHCFHMQTNVLPILFQHLLKEIKLE